VEQGQHFLRDQTKPHELWMTATPIPRTVALTALADYDVSFLKPHRPPNTVKTWVVGERKRKSSYSWIAKQLSDVSGQNFSDTRDQLAGSSAKKTSTQMLAKQALFVCPFIDQSIVEELKLVKSAKNEFGKLEKVFKQHRLELLHGRMKEELKTELFAKMMAGEADILVTTPVVEVGVDLPLATIIVIEGAERFGLAQLHQLRGRVGRRGQEAFCLLFVSEGVEDVAAITKRLDYFSKHYDGNALAEYDLKRRGSGQLLGLQQHGFGDLQFASWNDLELIELCKRAVEG
jgi:ATP-dependent DNA helicase RecG